MMIYNFHLFDSDGNCIFSLHPDTIKGENTTQILYGFLYSLKSFSTRMSPVLTKDGSFFTYTTTTYQLFFLEQATSMKMVLITDPNPLRSNDHYKQILNDFYRKVYVEYAVRNPMVKSKGVPIESVLFREMATEYMKTLL